MDKLWEEGYLRWRNTYTDIDLEMVFSVLPQVSATTDISELVDLSNRGPIKTDETTSEEFWSNPDSISQRR